MSLTQDIRQPTANVSNADAADVKLTSDTIPPCSAFAPNVSPLPLAIFNVVT
ncbi:hypothetical protein GALL_419440 [mine drainage metagenome]|uniref:Uncharacterized protein n=1 Tax=mine drainage metagenome TaxID=410659 RepID=A0A1J5PY19_9ZZZZ